MKKLYNIFKGWYKFIFKKRSQMAKDRLLVCSICPIRYKSLCTACGCEIHAKAEVEEEECPRGYWLKIPGNYQQPGI